MTCNLQTSFDVSHWSFQFKDTKYILYSDMNIILCRRLKYSHINLQASFGVSHWLWIIMNIGKPHVLLCHGIHRPALVYHIGHFNPKISNIIQYIQKWMKYYEAVQTQDEYQCLTGEILLKCRQWCPIQGRVKSSAVSLEWVAVPQSPRWGITRRREGRHSDSWGILLYWTASDSRCAEILWTVRTYHHAVGGNRLNCPMCRANSAKSDFREVRGLQDTITFLRSVCNLEAQEEEGREAQEEGAGENQEGQ